MIRALFATINGRAEARAGRFSTSRSPKRGSTHWFVEGEVPDTVNGRFAVLATIVALMTVRLEKDGEDRRHATVALTERLVETLDAELREMGLGDPTLGKQVRKLVGAVAGRVERWRDLVALGSDLDRRDPAKPLPRRRTAVRMPLAIANRQLRSSVADARRRSELHDLVAREDVMTEDFALPASAQPDPRRRANRPCRR